MSEVKRPQVGDARSVLEVNDLHKHFERTKGFLQRSRRLVRAVDGVSFTLQHGETLSLVGESGSGKTTTGRCLIRAIEPTSGTVHYDRNGERLDIASLGTDQLRQVRQEIRMIFQDPFSSLNPRMTLLQLVGEPLLINKRVTSKNELRNRVAELFELVHLDPSYMSRYPHALSGGQRQRIAIARALALDPSVVIADEAVSALDVSVQAQILNLLKELQSQRDLTYLFIAHDLAVVRYQSDRVAVMYLGKIVEIATRDEIFDNPQHPYTALLLASAPVPDPRKRRQRRDALGEIPDPAHRPSGCEFHPRCPYAQPICQTETPELAETASGEHPSHQVACHFWRELDLTADRTPT